MRCEREVTKHNFNILPPNTQVDQCSFQAVGTRLGKHLCQRHLDHEARSLARALAKQQDQLRRQHNTGQHTMDRRCDFCQTPPQGTADTAS